MKYYLYVCIIEYRTVIMTRTVFYQKFFSMCGKVAGAAATISGAYGFIKEIINPTKTFIELISSTTAFVVYALLAIVAICVLLNDKYKTLNSKNEELSKKIAELNLELSSAAAKLDSAMRNGQIARFKNRFFLATEKLYIDLAEKIHNNISISRMSIHNTIENEGVGDKRNSCIQLCIEGFALSKTSQIQILAAGDTIVNWNDINFKAFELVDGKRVSLNARLADNGQDSYLKQVVVSYATDKNEGDIVNLVIEWQWPNMLNVTSEDYTTLPIILAPNTQKIEMRIEPKIDINFDEVGVYEYTVGMSEAKSIKDLCPDVNNRIYYCNEAPSFKSCYILYYKIRNI